jgi:ribosome-associated protein
LSAWRDEVTFALIVAKQKTTKQQKVVNDADSLLDAIIFGLQEIKGHDIVVLDLRKLSYAMSDYFVVCHGTSGAQVKALADSVDRQVHKLVAEDPLHVEGSKNAKWVLMDYINVVVHIFDQESRNFYALEELWADGLAKKVV